MDDVLHVSQGVTYIHAAASEAPELAPARQSADVRELLGLSKASTTPAEPGWLLLRCELELPSEPTSAELRIGIDGTYQLFTNGSRLASGVGRPHRLRLPIDRFDLRGWLRKGRNSVGLVVRTHEGGLAVGNGAEPPRDPLGTHGLHLGGEIHCGDEVFSLTAPERWRCAVCLAWVAAEKRSTSALFAEVHDGASLPTGWCEPGFDDADWAPVQRDDVSAVSKVLGLGERRRDLKPRPVLRERVRPRDFARTPEDVMRVDALVSGVEGEGTDETREPLPLGLAYEVEGLCEAAPGATSARTLQGMGVSFLLDFGAIHSGRPFAEFCAEGGEVIEMSVAEGLPGEWDGGPRDSLSLARDATGLVRAFRYVARPGIQRFEAAYTRRFRYAELVVRNAPRLVEIQRVGSVGAVLAGERRGGFQCSDPDLNRIWRVSRETLEAARTWRREVDSGAPLWLGDLPVEIGAGQSAFGPALSDQDRHLLLQAAETQRPDGLIPCLPPGDRRGSAIPIPDATLHWILAVDLYHAHTGDVNTVEALLPSIQRGLSWFCEQLGEDDLLEDLHYGVFMDWAEVGRHGHSAVLNALFAGALRAAERMARATESTRTADRYAELATRIGSALDKSHWDLSRGLYVDTVESGTGQQGLRVSQHANAAMLLFDLAPEERVARILEQITDQTLVVPSAAAAFGGRSSGFDPEKHIVQASPWFTHFVLEALGHKRRADLLLHAIRALWGPMIERGATTLWERFEPIGGLCHGGSTTPLYQLQTFVLGVTPVDPGFTRVRVAPQPGDLSWAEGTVPTPQGDVAVSWQRDEYGLDLSVRVPENVGATLVGPPGFGGLERSRSTGSGRYEVRLIKDR